MSEPQPTTSPDQARQRVRNMSTEEFLKLLRDMGFGRPPINRIRHFDNVIDDPSARTERLGAEVIAAGLVPEGEAWAYIATVLPAPPKGADTAPNGSDPAPNSVQRLFLDELKNHSRILEDIKFSLKKEA